MAGMQKNRRGKSCHCCCLPHQLEGEGGGGARGGRDAREEEPITEPIEELIKLTQVEVECQGHG